MKKKFLGRLLTMLLVAAMVFTLLPASAIAAAEWWGGDEYADDAATQATDDYKYNIFFLDCGRKYYSVDSIKQFIDNASAAGFNYIQLAVGNDGLRFLLDDMSLTVNGTTYDSDAVKSAIHTGNEAYYNFDVDELTQSEMDTIIAYASSKGMGVIPCVNTPGHMDAILSAATSLTGTTCSYNGSARTIDVTNATAVAFTQALLQKYMTYFAGKGCKLFNMGADEYANDIYTGGAMGFGNLQDSGNYRYYVTYVNAVAAMIKKAGMKPMAFNDGIYYGSNTSSGEFDKDIIICYWSAGWSGYDPMSAAALANKGFKLVNTNGAYYWVLGKTDAQCDANKASGFDYKSFPGGTIDAPAGSMFCIWCDYPGAETEESVINKTADTIKAFGGALPVLTPTQPDTGITITPSKPSTGGTSNTVTMGEQMTLTANKKVYWSWNSKVVELTSADSDEAASTVALYAEQSLYAQSVHVTPIAQGDAGITVSNEAGESKDYPLTVQARKTEEITVYVGGSVPVPAADDVTITQAPDESIATAEIQTGSTSVPTLTKITSASELEDGATYLIENARAAANIPETSLLTGTNVSGKLALSGKPSTTSSAIAQWTITKTGSKYYIKNGSQYLNVGNASASLSSRETALSLSTKTNKKVGSAYWDIACDVTTGRFGSTTTTYHLNQHGGERETVAGGFTDDAGKDYGSCWNIYKLTEGSAPTTNIIFKGVAEGTTTATIGNVDYTIHVVAKELADVEPLSIEYWITNSRVKDESTNATEKKISAAELYGEGGKAITEFVPQNAVKQSDKNAKMLFWKATRLTEGNYQADENGNDKTMAGNDFSYIRYWNSQWEFSANGTNWAAFNSDDQVVAYYMQVTKVTNEVTTTVVDWGVPPSQLTWNKEDFALLDFSVKYESGERLPNTFANEKTVAYALDRTVTERHIGRINAIETAEYEVYMITVTPNNDNKNVSVADAVDKVTSGGYTYDGTEKVIWVDKEENLGDFADTTLHATGFRVGGEASIVDGITMNKKQGVLVTYYLRTKVTEDSLTVNYVDLANPSAPFYSYNIAVVSGTTFKSNIRLNDPAEQELLDGDVVNIKNKTQTVTADLKKMNGVPAAYRYASKFTCDHIALSGKDKVLTLYYTFDNSVSFVADFGLPLTIKAKELSNAFNDGSQITETKVSSPAQHGTVRFTGTQNMNIVYTPGATFPISNGDAFTVTYTSTNPETGKLGSASFVINILPASNVLYEENFLTAANDSGWRKAGSTPTTAQQPQKVGGDGSYNVFGYDNAYVKNGEQNVTGQLGVWQASGLQYSTSTGVMTTEFYGNGFDLIGSCGKNTGRILLGIFKGNEKRPVATRIIDTKFDDASVAEMLYQVPLAHVMLKDEAQYRVEIYASGVKEQTNNARANSRSVSAAAYSYDDYADGFASILDSYGVRMSDVEYIRFADIADSASAAATMSLRPVALADEGGAGSCSVEIDSFRVYRSGSDATYPANEQDVTYVNVLDRFTNGGFTAFVENGNGDGKWAKREDYESNGGPQNEIYLRKSDGTATGDAVAFNVGANQTVQISARAVETGKTAKMVVNGGTPVETEISSNTEMYYVVTAGDDGIITIRNTGEAMLALGNLKVKSTQTVAELSDEQIPMAIALLSMAPAPEEPEQPAAFTPEHFDAKVSATGLGRSKIVRLTVTTSSDVAKLTVNGKELRPVNGWLVKMGWSSSYTYILSEKMPRNDSRPFEIVCYNADGVASAAHVVTGQ